MDQIRSEGEEPTLTLEQYEQIDDEETSFDKAEEENHYHKLYDTYGYPIKDWKQKELETEIKDYEEMLR